jgi:hypothetical protein
MHLCLVVNMVSFSSEDLQAVAHGWNVEPSDCAHKRLKLCMLPELCFILSATYLSMSSCNTNVS